MSGDIFTTCECYCLANPLFASQTEMTVTGTERWPDLSDPELAGRTFLLTLTQCNTNLTETVRVTATNGNVFTIERAVGFNEVALDFCEGDQVCSVFGTALSEALNEIIDCVIEAMDCTCTFEVGEGPNGEECIGVSQVGNTVTLTNLIHIIADPDEDNTLTVTQNGCTYTLFAAPSIAQITPVDGPNGATCIGVVDDEAGGVNISSLIQIVADPDVVNNPVVVQQDECTYEISVNIEDFANETEACDSDPGQANVLITSRDYFFLKHSYVDADAADTGVQTHVCRDIVEGSVASQASGVLAGVYSSQTAVANANTSVVVGGNNSTAGGFNSGIYSGQDSTTTNTGSTVFGSDNVQNSGLWASAIGSEGVVTNMRESVVAGSSDVDINSPASRGMFIGGSLGVDVNGGGSASTVLASGGAGPTSTVINDGARVVVVGSVNTVIEGGSSPGVYNSFNSTVNPNLANIATLPVRAEQVVQIASDTVRMAGNESAIIASRGGAANDPLGNLGGAIIHGQRAVLIGSRNSTIGVDASGSLDSMIIGASSECAITVTAGAANASYFFDTILSSQSSVIENLDGATILSSRGIRMDDNSAQHGNWSVAGGVGAAGAAVSANKTWVINSINGNMVAEGGFTTAAVTDFAEVFPNAQRKKIEPGTPVKLTENGVDPAGPGDTAIGIISRTAGIILGDGPVVDKYEVDQWGEKVYETLPAEFEDVEVPDYSQMVEYDKENPAAILNPPTRTVKIKTQSEVSVPKRTAEFLANPVEEFKSQKHRDYSVVGMVGQIRARCSKTNMIAGQSVRIGADSLLENSPTPTNWIAYKKTSGRNAFDIWTIMVNGPLHA